MRCAILLIVALCLPPAIAACSESEPDAKKTAPSTPSDAAPDAASAGAHTAKIITAQGFTYDPADLTPGFPDVTTIRLGDRIRIWSRAAADWFPMTIALLDKDDISMVSFRMDVPPAGSITGTLPTTARPCIKVRITQVIAALDNPAFERRIGALEPEFTTPRLQDMGIISKDPEKHPSPTVDPSDNHKILDPAIEAVTTEFLKDQFGRDAIIDGSTVYFSGSNPWKSRPVSDAEWLDGRIKTYLKNIHNDRRTTMAP